LVSAAFIAACASSSGGLPPDAEQVPDAVVADASVPDASPPDAEPCFPDPDGETCNGEDDDCDDTTDEGYPGVGESCDVGVGACNVVGLTVCTKDGASTTCGATAGTPGVELCGTMIDEDCDDLEDEGFDNLGDVCSVGAGACLASGIFVCDSTGLGTTCNAVPGGGTVEVCDGVDNDCDTFIDDGFQVSQSCDGGDGDACNEGVWACDGAGGRECTDQTGTTFDVCDGVDNDCDPTSGDGSEDGAVGGTCDGAGVGQDSDLCAEGVTQCVTGALYCTDNTASTLDVCDGANNDCDPASADGTEDPALGGGCDGTDSDLCSTGVTSCGGSGSLVCSDDAAATVDTCDGVDNDCDPASADGTEQGGYGGACDSAGDTDLCNGGTMACNGSALYCTDDTASLLDVCDGADNDCDPASADGTEHAGYGVSCDDATDSDLCSTGAMACNGSALYCTDDTASTFDVCGGGDQDCNPTTADGSAQAGFGAGCDSAVDTDLCSTGVGVCSGTSVVCSDDDTSIVDQCGNGDEDCDPASGDGSEHPGYNAGCDSASDTDLCATGNMLCSGTVLACNDLGTDSTLDLCGGGDEDCDGASGDGSEQSGFGVTCDSLVDTDLCATGVGICSGSSVVCSDDAASLVDLCGGGNEDCDTGSVDGSEDPAVSQWCDGSGDTDSCQEALSICTGGALACPDNTSSTIETCDGSDQDCNGVIDDDGGNTNMACSSSTYHYMGGVSGDEGGSVSVSRNVEYWERVFIEETSLGGEDIVARIQLTSPPGADYDLYVYCSSCGGTYVGGSALGGLDGHTDTVDYQANDDDFTWDDGYVVIEVRHWNSTSCGTWTLTVTGDVGSASEICNP